MSTTTIARAHEPAANGHTPPSLGLHGWRAHFVNMSASAILAGLLIWLLTVSIPQIHRDVAARQSRLEDRMLQAFERNTQALHELTLELRTSRNERSRIAHP